MASAIARLRQSRSWWFDLVVLVAGLLSFGVAAAVAAADSWAHLLPALVGVPLIVVIARFPMVLDNGKHGVEVGFDSSVLMFLLCTVAPHDALVVWSIGVIVTQVTTNKRLASKVFNIGVGLLAGSYAAGILILVRGDGTGTLWELLAVALAAAGYFATDFVLSALSVAIASRTSVRSQLAQPGTLFAIACFVPFDTLGYLAAVVHRSTPWWTLTLFAVPLVTLLVATRALTRGREHARRLATLLDAAVGAQTLRSEDEVLDFMDTGARDLLRLERVELRATGPRSDEIGAQVFGCKAGLWIVARATERARSTVAADEHALKALAAVASEAFGRIELTAEMVHVARHDPLTDLPNRGILLDRLSEALESVRRRGTRLALLVLDLDGFKPVNDRFGHATGDAVLVELAQRLVECVRSTDTVARLGGDEFAILVEDIDESLVDALCDRVLATVGAGVTVAGQRVPVGVSLGVAYGDGVVSPAGLARQADLAMYEAKERGKGRYVQYEQAIGQARLERLEMVEDLRGAVAAAEIAVAYQPVIDAHSGRIYGAEALARWQRDGKPVPPDVFINLAEENGLIVPLGQVVLDRVVADAASVREVVGEGFVLAVNISVCQLRDPGFVLSVRRAVESMPAVALVLEITERQGVDTDPVVLDAMRRIAAMGVRFAIDDFGVGFSSISYLHALPAQILKVDASLSKDIDHDARADSLLSSVTLMGRALGLDVVVEGIERETQLERIRADGHPMLAQGYLMHRPMPVLDLLEVLGQESLMESVAGG